MSQSFLAAGDGQRYAANKVSRISIEHKASTAIYNNRREIWSKADDIAGIAKPGVTVAYWRSLAFSLIVIEFNSTRKAIV